MNLLVAGCAGFIGARVTALLLAEGHAVCGIDNLNDAYDVRLKLWRLERLRVRRGFAFHQMDIADRAGLRTALDEGFDAVVNLAARAGVRQSVAAPWVYIDTNVTGTLNLLDLCRERGVPKFILASTSSLYGASPVQPFREDANTDTPLSPYAASKKAAEMLCYTYHHLFGLDISVLRYFTVYGPAGRPDMSLFRFVQWVSEERPVTVYGDGLQSRDFTYVDDIARGTVAALRPTGFEIINLGSDHPVVLLDVLRLVEEAVGKRAVVLHSPSHPADVPATWADISKARRLLDWSPQTAIAEGVSHLVRWYAAEREWARNVETSETVRA